MKRKLVLTAHFEKTFHKVVKRDALLQKQLEKTLAQMQADLFANQLSTHKLVGKLTGLWACSCGYDCRIIFSLQKTVLGDEVILLINIGTHDKAY